MKSKKKHFRIDRDKIGLLRFILEGYEGIATLTTIDPAQGRVVLLIPPGCEKEVDALLAELAAEFFFEPDAPVNDAQDLGPCN